LALRDKAVTAGKRKQLQKERAAKMPNAFPKSEGRRRAIDASSKAPFERSGDFNPSMLLTGALPVTPRLIRVHLAHTLEKIFGIGLRNIWRPRPFAAALFRLPWNWSWWFWFLPPFGHARMLTILAFESKSSSLLRADSGPWDGVPTTRPEPAAES